jgi:hypothetical protein
MGGEAGRGRGQEEGRETERGIELKEFFYSF